MQSDILTDALNLVHLSGALIFRIEVKGPWCIESNLTVEHLAERLPAGSDQLIAFHVVIQGRCWFQHGDHDWFAAKAGDAVVLPHGGMHRLGDKTDMQAIPFEQALGRRKLTELKHARFNIGDGAKTSILCGFLGCNRRAFQPLCASMPGLFHVHLGAGDGSLAALAVRQILDDAPGADSVRLRLTEALFLESLRKYLEYLPEDAKGWLAAVRDPIVGRALRALHDQPRRNWSVEDLAQLAASSRSRLATRFREVLGEPPMHYLTRLRMQRAADLMQQGPCTLAGVSEHVGYESVAAFQRAFKRHFGTPPGEWRRDNTAA